MSDIWRSRPRAAVVLGVGGAWLAVLGAMLFIDSRSIELPLRNLTRDTTSVGNLHPLTGAMSSFGVLCWATGFGATLNGWLAARGVHPTNVTRILWTTAALTAFLMLDDQYLFHEALAERYLGISEYVVLALYPVLAMVYLVVNWRTLLDRDAFLALAAFSLLGLSVVVDVTPLEETRWGLFLEDAFKLGGILFWAAFCVRLGYTSGHPPSRAAHQHR